MFRFGAFELDLNAQQVRKNGVRIRLQSKPFQLLVVLLERAGDVVTREEFHRLLWGGDPFGEFDHNLNNAINKLRRALNDCAATPRYIETLPRVGYRFVGPVERVSPEVPALAAPRPGPPFRLAWTAALAVFLTFGALAAVGYTYLHAKPQPAAAVPDSRNVREAHELYLKGRYFWNKRNKSQIFLAINYFQDAIAKDPQYALAYSGLADSYSVLGMLVPNPAEFYQKASDAALESVRLDERSAEAHTSLAMVHLCNWRFPQAAAEFQKAIAINPNYPTAHHWYGLHLRENGRGAEGLKELELAHHLDPVSLQISFALANAYRKDGHYQEAEKHFLEIVRFDSSFHKVNAGLALLYANQHHFPDSLASRMTVAAPDDFPGVSEYVAVGLYMAGRKEQAAELMTEVARQVNSMDNQCFPFLLAAMGERDKSINCLEKGYAEKAGYIAEIYSDPVLRELRSDPRFQDLLARVGFPSGAASPAR